MSADHAEIKFYPRPCEKSINSNRSKMMKVRPTMFRIIGTLFSFNEWEDKDFLIIGDGWHTKCENGFHFHA